MAFWAWLLFSYGLCFGLANKVGFLHGRLRVLDKLLQCPYCLGFHTGWMTWLVANAAGETGRWPWHIEVPVWAITSAAFCYTLDRINLWLEGSK